MQRLFSTFPAGRPGAGLLLLRVAVGVVDVVLGGVYLAGVTEASAGPWIGGVLAITSGLLLIVGMVTPFAAAVVVLGGVVLAVRGWPSSLSASLVGVVAAAIVLLGPGAYSLDARLFGRREIIIRATPRPPTP